MRCQPRLKNGRGVYQTRDPLPSCVDPRVKAAVERDAIRWDCSRSWIVATALAAFYGVDIMKPFEVKKRKVA